MPPQVWLFLTQPDYAETSLIEDGSGGNVASTLFMQSPHARAAAIAATADPALRSLLAQKLALEDQIAALKLQKAKMDPADYEQALEKLATDLALKTRAIQQIEEELKTKILSGDLRTDLQVYTFSLEQGFLPRHANKIMSTLKAERRIDFNFNLATNKIHKISSPSIIQLR